MKSETRLVLKLLLGLTILVLLGWLLWLLRSLLVALTIAGLLAYLLNPVIKRLARRLQNRRSLAAILIYLLLLLVLIGPVGLVVAFVLERWSELRQELGEAVSVITGWFSQPIPWLGFEPNPEVISDSLQTAWENMLSSFSLSGSGLIANITDNLLWTLVVFVALFYLMRDGHRIVPGLLRLLPEKYAEDAEHLVTQIDLVWGVFLRVQLYIFAILGVLVVTSTGLIIWLFRQGWLPLSPFGLILLLIVVYIAIQQIDNLWLRPQLMGEALDLHPGLIFVGLIAGLAVSGLLGALLVVPLLATAKVVGQFILAKYDAGPDSEVDVETAELTPDEPADKTDDNSVDAAVQDGAD